MPVVHPLLRLVVEQPELLAEHVTAYAVAFAEEGALAAARLRRRLAWLLVACACGVGTITLAGIAVMLWATLPLSGLSASETTGVLVAVPIAMLAAGACAMVRALRHRAEESFAGLRRNVAADLALIRGARSMAGP